MVFRDQQNAYEHEEKGGHPGMAETIRLVVKQFQAVVMHDFRRCICVSDNQYL